MDVILTPEQARLVRAKVASGLYASPSDAIDQALRLLEDRDRLDALRLDELFREIAAGLADSAAPARHPSIWTRSGRRSLID